MRYFLLTLMAISILFFPDRSPAQEYTTWGLPDGAKARFGKGQIKAIRFSPEGSLLAVGSTVGLWLYDAHTGKEIALLSGSRGSSKIVFSPDGKLLASAGGGIIQLWDIATYSELHTFSNNITGRLGETMAFTDDGKTLISLGWKWESQFQAWDVHSGELLTDVPSRKRRPLPVRKDKERSVSVSTDDPGQRTERVYYAKALSPDGSLVAGRSGREILLTDVRTGEVIPTVMPILTPAGEIVFSPDSTLFATIAGRLVRSSDGTIARRGIIRLWEVSSSSALAAIKLPSRVNALAFAPDGRTFATASEKTAVRLHEVSTGKRILSFTPETGPALHTDAIALAFSPDGETLAIATEDTVGMWDVRTGRQASTFAAHPSMPLLITAANKNFLSGELQLRDIRTGQVQADLTAGITAFLSQAGEIVALALSPDGTTFVTGNEAGCLHLWNAETGELLSILTGHTGSIRALTFTADNALLASASEDGTIRLWEVAAGKLKATLTEHDIGVAVLEDPTLTGAEVLQPLQPKEFGESQEPEPPQPVEESEDAVEDWHHLVSLFVNNLAFSPHGTMLASASTAGTIWLWEVDTGRLKATLKELEPWMPESRELAKVGLAFSPDGTRLASSSWEGTIMLSELHTEQIPLFLPGNAGPEAAIKFTPLAWAPDGTRLVSGSMDETLQIWDTETGTELGTIRGHTGGITGLAFSQNGKTVASASWDGTILLWDWDKIASANK